MKMLKVENIQKSFGKTEVLKNISFSLEKGEVLAIIGSSGSGKTTLLRCLNFLETPQRGRITVNSEVLFDSSDSSKKKDLDVRKKRLHFGLVFQNFNLFPQYKVYDNITLAPLLMAREQIRENGSYYGAASLREAQQLIREEADNLLKKVGLFEKRDSYPGDLSGGQQQRVAIARALVTKPSLLLADEPTGNLDSHTSREIMDMFCELHEQGNTIVLITHDSDVAKQAKRIIRILDGRLTEVTL